MFWTSGDVQVNAPQPLCKSNVPKCVLKIIIDLENIHPTAISGWWRLVTNHWLMGDRLYPEPAVEYQCPCTPILSQVSVRMKDQPVFTDIKRYLNTNSFAILNYHAKECIAPASVVKPLGSGWLKPYTCTNMLKPAEQFGGGCPPCVPRGWAVENLSGGCPVTAVAGSRLMKISAGDIPVLAVASGWGRQLTRPGDPLCYNAFQMRRLLARYLLSYTSALSE